MKTTFLTILFAFFGIMTVSAQMVQPVKWSYDKKKITEDTYELIFTANINPGWSIYSQYMSGDEGPIPTSFEYEKNGTYTLVGKAVEAGTKTEKYDNLFGMNLIKLSGNVTFSQKVKITPKTKVIEGYLTYMSCDKERCLPPDDVDFSFQF